MALPGLQASPAFAALQKKVDQSATTTPPPQAASPRKAADGSARGTLGQSAHAFLFGQQKTPVPKPSGNALHPKTRSHASSPRTPRYEDVSPTRKKTWGHASQPSSEHTSTTQPFLLFSKRRRPPSLGVAKEVFAGYGSGAAEKGNSKPSTNFSAAGMSALLDTKAQDVSGMTAPDSPRASNSSPSKSWCQPEKLDSPTPLMFSRKRVAQTDSPLRGRSFEALSPLSIVKGTKDAFEYFSSKGPLSPKTTTSANEYFSSKGPLSPKTTKSANESMSPKSPQTAGDEPTNNANRQKNVELLHSFLNVNLDSHRDSAPEDSHHITRGNNIGAGMRAKGKLACATRRLLASINPQAPALVREGESDKKEISEDGEDKNEDHQDEDVNFSLTDQAVLRRYFTMRDADGSGSLDLAELMKVLDDMGRLPVKGSEDALKLEELRIALDDNGNGELEFDEFLIFLAAYYKSVYERIFYSVASQGEDALVPIDKLHDMFLLLKDAGFAVDHSIAPEDVQYQLQGILNKCDFEVGHYLTFKEFCEMMKHYRFLEFCHLQKNAGLSPERMQFLQDLFEENDDDSSGSLDIKEIAQLFEEAFKKPINDIDRFVELFARTDIDKSASLDFEEFLRLFMVWEKEMNRQIEGRRGSRDFTGKQRGYGRASTLARAKSIHGLRTSQTISFEDDAAKLANELDDFAISVQKEKELNEIYSKVLGNDVEDGILARQWDVSLCEVRAVRESFEFCDVDGSGTIDHDELVPLFDNVGFKLDTKLQKKTLNDCRRQLKGDDDLDFRDIVILIATYTKFLAKAVAQDMGVTDIPVDRLVLVWYQMGHQVTRKMVDQMLKDVDHSDDADGVDETTFAKMIANHRSQTLMEWRKTCGFEQEIIAEFAKTVAGISGEDASNGVTLDQALLVLQELGYAPKEKADADTLMHALTRVDRNGTGKLTFDELLLLLRHLDNRRQVKEVEEENEKAESIGLDADSVKFIRSAFNLFASGHRGLVKQFDIKILLGSKFPVVQTQNQRKQLDILLNNMSKNDEELEFSFIMFLEVLSSLDDSGLF